MNCLDCKKELKVCNFNRCFECNKKRFVKCSKCDNKILADGKYPVCYPCNQKIEKMKCDSCNNMIKKCEKYTTCVQCFQKNTFGDKVKLSK